jgi:hypothetical protein
MSKTLKFVFIFLSFLILGVVSILLLSPKKIQYTTTITINAPLSKSWSAFLNPDTSTLWIRNLDTIVHVSGNPGEIGSVSKLLFSDNERKVEMLETITERENFKVLAFRSELESLMTIQQRVVFAGNDSQTTIDSENEVVAKGFFMRLALWGAKTSMKEQMDTSFEKFKLLLE